MQNEKTNKFYEGTECSKHIHVQKGIAVRNESLHMEGTIFSPRL
jgi:hypothetical protein